MSYTSKLFFFDAAENVCGVSICSRVDSPPLRRLGLHEFCTWLWSSAVVTGCDRFIETLGIKEDATVSYFRKGQSRREECVEAFWDGCFCCWWIRTGQDNVDHDDKHTTPEAFWET